MNRNDELKILEGYWAEPDFSLVILYGRRRTGKTRLLTEFAKGKTRLYYTSVELSYALQCQEFSKCALQFLDLPLSGDFLEVIKGAAKIMREKILVILDEFQYIVQADPSFPSRLQREIDQTLHGENLMLVLCGSSVSFFEKKLLGFRNPLFGRRQTALKVKPLGFRELKAFFPRYGLEDLVRIYGVVGGTPMYLNLMDPDEPLFENISRILSRGQYLFDEVPNFLRQEVRNPRTYFSILAAISGGKGRPSKIAEVAGVDPRVVGKYLAFLEELDIVKVERPPRFKNVVNYEFADNYFRFWFRYIHPMASLLELGLVEEAMGHVKEDLPEYTGGVFENLVRELVPHLHASGTIPTRPVELGRWWHKGVEIDAVVRDPGRSTTFVEVKWSGLTKRETRGILAKLKTKAEKTGLMSPTNHFLVVARKIAGLEGPWQVDEVSTALSLPSIGKILDL
ncbi:MAG: ATP-binding protein [Promethearchaeota archaeon]